MRLRLSRRFKGDWWDRRCRLLVLEVGGYTFTVWIRKQSLPIEFFEVGGNGNRWKYSFRFNLDNHQRVTKACLKQHAERNREAAVIQIKEQPGASL